ncbi:VENN motif pre-toxin domain-containing protein, partial [Gilliamella sp. App2-1]|uniref:VENN motif pre-toxin domain-containing protein n=1 Tax=Gilliamella sp. App2-1 TaxID=3120230 RepID=UPI000AD39E24
INELSRDTEHASHALKHIFNKDKEQSIIDQTRLVSEIGGETLTMLNHIDRISATSKAKEALNKEQEKAKNNKTVLTDEQQQKIYEDAYKEAMNQGMSAMGSETRQGIDMAVNLINGIISGDMTGAVAGALAPKIASAIKKQTEHYNPETGKWETDHIANTVSHAILGGVVAQLQGNLALVGGLGAAASERSAEVIAGILYPDKDIKDLSQEERQQISALTQLATGLATAAAGGDIQDINTGVAAGKNAVENNGLSWADGGFGGDFIGLSPETGANYDSILHASANGYLTPEEASQIIDDMNSGKFMYDPLREDLMRLPEDLAILVTPYGDYIAFRDADSWGDYAIAAAGVLPFAKFIKVAGKVIKVETKTAQVLVKEAEVAYKAGNVAEGNRLMNQAASQSKQIETTVVKNSAAGKGTGANKPLDKTVLETQHGKGSVAQDGGNYKEIKYKIHNSQAANQKGNESSKFGEHVKNEKELNAGKGTTGQITPDLPKTRERLYEDLKSKGFTSNGQSQGGYETWKGSDGVTVTIKPTGEVIRTQRVWKSDRSGKYSERQDYFGNRLPDQSHSTGHFVE